MNLRDFHRRFEGADIYVLGSGKTLDYYDPAFFENRLTVGTNFGWSQTLDEVDFMVTKYHEHAIRWWESGRVGTVVTTRGQRGHVNLEPLEHPDICIADHNDNTVERWNPAQWPQSEHALVATHSSITTALHFAAYLGAKNIITVGADAGELDDALNMDGYDGNKTNHEMLRSFDQQNKMVADELRRRYKVNIMTMLPFVTPNMEGHKFRSYAGALNAS